MRHGEEQDRNHSPNPASMSNCQGSFGIDTAIGALMNQFARDVSNQHPVINPSCSAVRYKCQFQPVTEIRISATVMTRNVRATRPIPARPVYQGLHQICFDLAADSGIGTDTPGMISTALPFDHQFVAAQWVVAGLDLGLSARRGSMSPPQVSLDLSKSIRPQ